MFINSNIPALIAQNNLNTTAFNLSQNIQRLSSGLRINKAADDAAGLAISQSLAAQSGGIQQAAQNAQDGVSMVQTADGALSQAADLLQRMNQLAVQASNGTLSSTDRAAIQTELNQIVSSLTSISTGTTFNGLNLLTGNLSVTYASGSGTVVSASALVTVASFNPAGAAPGSSYTFSVCTFKSTAQYATVTNGVGVTQDITVRAMGTNDSQVLNFSAMGVQVALQTSTTAANATQVLQALTTGGGNATFSTSNASGAATIQIGPTQNTTLGLNFIEIDAATLGVASPNVSTTVTAGNLITQVQNAINTLSNQRAQLGALQNGLQDTINNLNVANINVQSALSQIIDVNVASETVDFTKNQILQQAGTSVLAQANLAPASVLTLLR